MLHRHLRSVSSVASSSVLHIFASLADAVAHAVVAPALARRRDVRVHCMVHGAQVRSDYYLGLGSTGQLEGIALTEASRLSESRSVIAVRHNKVT